MWADLIMSPTVQAWDVELLGADYGVELANGQIASVSGQPPGNWVESAHAAWRPHRPVANPGRADPGRVGETGVTAHSG